jgi:hypothetical protein
MPALPWPNPDNPMLAALFHGARKNIAVLGVDAAMIQLATHCWFEGGIEGHDHGRSDAQSAGGVACER